MSETLFFGPPAGAAGTSVRYTDSSPQVRSGELGITCLVAPFQKGLLDVVQRLRDKAAFRRYAGRVLADDYSGVAAHAFLELARGAGQLHALRVPSSTGLEAEAKRGELRLYARNVLASRLPTAGAASTYERQIALRAAALSPGDWSGPAFEYTGTVDDRGITGNTIDLRDAAFLADELVGCKFKIGTFAYEFTVTGNTAPGVLTLDRGFTGYTVSGGMVLYQLYRRNVDTDNERMEATVRVGDDPTQPATRCTLTPGLDGAAVSPTFKAVDLADVATLERQVQDAIRTGYAEVQFDDDDSTVGDTALPQSRPANWAGIAQPASLVAAGADVTVDHGKARVESGKLYVQVHELIIDTAAGGQPKLTAAPTIPSGCIPQLWELTFTGAANFNATLIDPLTGRPMASSLPGGATGSAYPGTGLAHPRLASFTVAVDGTIAVGTKVRLYLLPLESGLASKGAVVYAAAWTGAGYSPTSTDPGANPAQPAITTAFKVVSNGPDWVKLAAPASTLPTAFQAPKAPWIRGTDTGNAHNIAVAKTFKYIITVAGVAEAEVTLTTDALGGAATTTALAADLNAKDVDGNLYFYADSTNRLVCVLKRGDAGGLVQLQATDGTLNALVGITDQTERAGQNGAVLRVEYDQGLCGARPEAHEVVYADLQNALSTATNGALRQWVEAQPGLVTLYLPGVSDPTTVQAAIDFAEAVGCWVRFDLPDTLSDELAARGWLQANITPRRVFEASWPSWGRTARSPRDDGNEMVPVGAAALGAEAAWASSRIEGAGYHKAPAGTHMLLSPYIGALVRNSGGITPASLAQAPRTDEATLNKAGIQPVMQSGPAVYLYGDEGPNKNWNGTFWLHKQKAMLHLVALLRTNFDALIYHANNAAQRVEVLKVLRALLRPLWDAGWFDVLEDGLPYDFDNCVRIQSDETNNPQAVRDLGKLVAAVEVRIVNTTKSIEIQLGTGGIAVPIGA